MQKIIPQHVLNESLPKFKILRYYEPFLGAGSLFFSNKFTESVLSDINEHLINTYNQIKRDPFLVNEELVYHKIYSSKEYYYKIRQLFNIEKDIFSAKQAARFIYLVQSSFNGIYRVNLKGEYNVPFGRLDPPLPSLENLIVYSKKLDKSVITCSEYEPILNSVKRGDFVYVDPPYHPTSITSSFQHYTIEKFPYAKQEILAEYIKYIDSIGAYFMLSHSNAPSIRDLYKNWNISEISTVRSVTCKPQRNHVTEIIVKNY